MHSKDYYRYANIVKLFFAFFFVVCVPSITRRTVTSDINQYHTTLIGMNSTEKVTFIEDFNKPIGLDLGIKSDVRRDRIYLAVDIKYKGRPVN